ncbi:carbohydrate kinase family protein [archaeon]|nr:carbohydrate kinase family protein [archaeon]
MMAKLDIVTFGSGVIDVFASTSIPEKKGKLDLEIGSKYLIDNLRTDVGGGGTNVAVAFARFGFKTGCVCGVGKDANGREVLGCLKKEKIKFLGKIGGGKTGYSVIVDSKKNNRTILTFKGESNEVGGNSIKRFGSKWLYFSSLLGKSFVAQRRLAAKMVGGGVKLAFNPSSYSIERQNIGGLLRLSYVLVLNKEEAVSLAKRYYKSRKKLGLLEKLHSLGPKVVVVTDKNKAVRCFDGKKGYSVVPNKSKKVVERTGAGDAFAAGFVAGMIRGFEISKCLELGIEESEAVLGHFGAKNNLIRRKLK